MTFCVALLGGSFDPVHEGHVALAALFNDLLRPDLLRVIPAGNPWQKRGLQATAEQRIAMLELAFCAAGLPIVIDRQEIERTTPTYTIETLRNVRAELGPDASIVFLMGADQLQHLDSWVEWRGLFDLAHIGVAARPGFALEDAALPPEVAQELQQRRAEPAQLRTRASGLATLAHTLAVDVSSTQIRKALGQREHPNRGLAPVVLDYIQQHNLYNT
ncbi:MAG: nicotinate-nucleotide adenylyltransferase [Gammaproteobacteria bacterium]